MAIGQVHDAFAAAQRHGFVPVGKFAQGRQSRGGRRCAGDVKVLAEPAAEIVSERAQYACVIIDHKYHR